MAWNIGVPHEFYELQKESGKGPVIRIYRVLDIDDFVGLVWQRKKGKLTRFSPTGEKIVTTREEFREECLKYGNSAFVRRRTSLILWVSENPDIIDLVKTLGHEYGHIVTPFFEDDRTEERKAGKFGDAATFAMQMATEFLKEQDNGSERRGGEIGDDSEQGRIRSFLLLKAATRRASGKGADEDAVPG